MTVNLTPDSGNAVYAVYDLERDTERLETRVHSLEDRLDNLERNPEVLFEKLYAVLCNENETRVNDFRTLLVLHDGNYRKTCMDILKGLSSLK